MAATHNRNRTTLVAPKQQAISASQSHWQRLGVKPASVEKLADVASGVQHAPMIILVGGEKGGAGKTTVAVNLSVWLAGEGRDVLLVDTDPQASAQKWAQRRPEDAARVQCVQLTGRVAPQIVDLARRYDDVIIDCGGRDSVELRGAMLVADLLVSPTLASQVDLETVGHVVELVEGARIQNESLQTAFFLNCAPTNQKSEERGALAALRDAIPEEMTVMDAVLANRRAFRDAIRDGLGVLEWSDDKAKAEFSAFCDAVQAIVAARTEAA